MANLLKMAISETIRTLHRRGWSQRRIADELGINRETVARHLRQADPPPKPANAPPGSERPTSAPKPANAPPGSEAGPRRRPRTQPLAPAGSTPDPQPRGSGRASGCEPWRDLIRAKCDLGLTAQRIYQDLVADHGFAGSYYCVRRFVHRLEQTHDLPFRRIECDPGDEAQVDFGTGAPLVGPDGKRRKTHVLRVVLSHSRKGYSEAVYRQTTDDFLRCLEDAFRHFGGVPRRLVLDNLKAAVTKADWFDPEINPKVRSFGEHYGTVFLPTRPYTPRHKGKVERGVDYVQENALRGRSFASLEEQNRFLRDWELTVADTRVHGTTRRHVGKHFEEVERAALLPLPLGPVPVVPRGPPHGAPRRPRRGRARLLLGAAGVPRPPGLGPLGRPDGADLQRPDGAARGARQAGAGAVQHAVGRTSPRRRSAGSSGARPGTWPGCVASGPRAPAGPRRWSRRGASRRSGS